MFRLIRPVLALSLALVSGQAVAATSTVAAARTLPPQFEFDVVSDAGIFGAALGFGTLLELIIRTGELSPQEPRDPSVLLGIDRGTALSDDLESSARILSDLAVGTAATYAIVDSVLATVLDRRDGGWTYATLYAESAIMNFAIANLSKIAVRRPRPVAYRELRQTGESSVDTNSALSFYSLHTAMVAGLSSTATYMAFVRDDSSWEPWIIGGVGAVLTGLVGVQRVRARSHFPTDVIAGALAGAGIGLIVPHLHLVDDDRLKASVGGYVEGDRAGITLSGRF